ncbi:MAG TPA: Ig-like domain-containing protein [Anaerolineae bacterium]|nr:Ig-like domain-containing protein [Anaerolineae bacterium]
MNRIPPITIILFIVAATLTSLFWLGHASGQHPTPTQKETLHQPNGLSPNDIYTTVTNLPLVVNSPISTVLANDNIIITDSWSMPTTNVHTGTLSPLWDIDMLIRDAFDYKPSFLLVQNKPALAYVTPINNNWGVYYMRAHDENGQSWPAPTLIATLAATETERINSPLIPSLTIIQGKPALAYYSDTYIYYTSATDTLGDNWQTPQIIRPTGFSVVDLHLQEVANNPAIIYAQELEAFYFIRALDTTGQSWANPVFLGDLTTVVLNLPHIQATIVNNHPAVLYKGKDTDPLFYRRALDAEGVTWGAPLTITVGTSINPLLQTNTAGEPLIVYSDDQRTYLLTSSDNGASWLTQTLISTATAPLILLKRGDQHTLLHHSLDFDASAQIYPLFYTQWQDATSHNPITIPLIHINWSDVTAALPTKGGLLLADSITPEQAIDLVLAQWEGNFIYDPPLNYTGIVTFTYHNYLTTTIPNDNLVTINITPNSPPQTMPDLYEIPINDQLVVDTLAASPLVNDHDDNNNQQAHIVSHPITGQLNYAGSAHLIADYFDNQYIDWQTRTQAQYVANKPAITYATSDALYYLHATDTLGQQWSPPITIDDGLIPWHSFQKFGDHIAITYLHQTAIGAETDLKYTYALNPQATEWSDPITILTENIDHDIAIMSVNNAPAIVYGDMLTHDIKYIRATDHTGTSWSTPLTLMTTSDANHINFIALTADNGSIAVAISILNDGSYYLQSVDNLGTVWSAPSLIHNMDSSFHLSLIPTPTDPVIKYTVSYLPTSSIYYMRNNGGNNPLWQFIPANPQSPHDLINIEHSRIQKVNNQLLIFNSRPQQFYQYQVALDPSGLRWQLPINLRLQWEDNQSDHNSQTSQQIANDTGDTGLFYKTSHQLTANNFRTRLYYKPLLPWDGLFTYQPPVGFTGIVTFTYQLNDGYALSAEQVVTITVSDTNQLPVGQDDFYYFPETEAALQVDSAEGVLANDFDADGDTLQAELVTDVSEGLLSLASNGAFIYLPPGDGSFDSTSFQYRIYDGRGWSDAITAVITRHPNQIYMPITISNNQ